MSISKITEHYLDTHPSVRDCIIRQLVNYSKLSRLIIRDSSLNASDFDAVLVACRRYRRKMIKSSIHEDRIIAILKDSRIEVKNKVAAVVIDKDIFSDDLLAIEKIAKKNHDVFYAIEGSRSITLVVSSGLLDSIKKFFRSSIRKHWTGLALVIIKSPEGEQDSTPGFMNFVTGRISSRSINVLEFMSCWSETLLVVEEKDIAGVMNSLSV